PPAGHTWTSRAAPATRASISLAYAAAGVASSLAGAPAHQQATFGVTVRPSAAGKVTLTATAYVDPGCTTTLGQPQGTDLTVTPGSPAILLTASASPVSLPAWGGVVTHSYVVRNRGNVPLSNVTVTDDKLAGATATGGA